MSNSASLRSAAAKVLARCRELASISDVPGQTTRTFLSPATRAAQALVGRWMREAGLTVTIDAIGNLHGLAPEAVAGVPRLLIGSHLDTVVNAGAFDGPLGVLCGIALAERAQKERLPFAIEVLAFSEEEGIRFRRAFLGSLALIGSPVPETITDAEGITLAQAIADFGHGPSAADCLAEESFAYFEIHIEQGPVLEEQARSIAAVNAIAGQSRLELTFQGLANHAGTTPMHLRRDAAAAAAAWAVEVEAHAVREPGLVATVGSFWVSPSLGNVIAGEAVLSLDVRHGEDAVRRAAVDSLLLAAGRASAERNVLCTWRTHVDQPAVAMDARLTAQLGAAAARQGFDAAPMVSGAGHDAMVMARRIPACMLFVRTPGGLSHHPDEAVYVEDVEAALATSFAFLESLEPPAAEEP